MMDRESVIERLPTHRDLRGLGMTQRMAAALTSLAGIARPTDHMLYCDVLCAVKLSCPSTVIPRYHPSGVCAMAALKFGLARSPGDTGGSRAMKCPVQSTRLDIHEAGRCCAWISFANPSGSITAVRT